MVKCPLCENIVSNLHKKSHIIPNFILRAISDEKNRLTVLDQTGKDTTRQTGFWGTIVCGECEINFSKDDLFAAHFFRDKTIPFQKRLMNVGNLDYEFWSYLPFKKIQKMILGIILRNHFHFRNLNKNFLNEIHFIKMKSLYLSDELNDEEYPIIIFGLKSKLGFESIVEYPYIANVDGHKTVSFNFLGFYFSIFVSSHKKPKCFEGIKLNKNGECCLIYEVNEDRKSFQRFITKFRKAREEKSFPAIEKGCPGQIY